MADFPGTPGNDTLTGGALADTLSGFSGDDRLIGGGGADQLDGGDDFDVADYSTSPGSVEIDLDTGTASGGDAAGDTLTSIEGLAGSDQADTLLGDDQDNRLTGRGGADILDGREGNDRITGGLGADTLRGGRGLDTVLYTRSAAAVEIDLEMALQSGGSAEGDRLDSFENVIGSAFGDTISGTAGANVLRGEAGNDALYGRGGRDVLSGGRGDDRLDGGGGFDFVTYARATENVAVNTRNDQYLGAARGDMLVSIEGLIGTAFGDSLILGDDDNVIFGRGGDDFIDGGLGDDLLIGGAGGDFMHGSTGSDTVSYAGSAEGVQVFLDLSAQNAGGDALGDTLSNIENIRGSAQDDVIVGNLLSNTLSGQDGDDILGGRDGRDILRGGSGADQFEYISRDNVDAVDQDIAVSITAATSASADRIVDFDQGTDLLRFASDAFGGSVLNTTSVAAFGFTDSAETGFAFDGGHLYFLSFADADAFAADQVTVHHVADLLNVAALTDADFTFV